MTSTKESLDNSKRHWPIKIFTLGRFVIVKNGQPLSFSRKVPRKPLEMLKVIIALGCRDVSKDQITDALWPESYGDMANKSFTTTMGRIKKVVGDDNVLLVNYGRVSLNTESCWVDTIHFQRCMSMIHKLAETKKELRDTEQVQLLEKAIGLYNGHFLSSYQNESWIVSKREHLKQQFARCVQDLGRYYEKTGDDEKVINCYLKGIELDDLNEDFYYNLICFYVQKDRNIEARQVYQRCKKVLSTVLDLEPCPEIQSLYKKIN